VQRGNEYHVDEGLQCIPSKYGELLAQQHSILTEFEFSAELL
jgi:hypothetical protein